MEKNSDKYKPALNYDWLTRFYDPLIQWTLREETFKSQLIRQAQIQTDHHVLDLACGTATLTILIKNRFPEATVIGLDGDPKVLEIARAKLAKEQLDIPLDLGMSFDLPYTNNSFDRVLSSLFFHHLTRENKSRTLAEVHRVLKPGGEIHIADWGRPRSALMRTAFFLVQMLDGFATTKDNADGLIPQLLLESGFIEVSETVQYPTLFGPLSLYSARKPD
ncbi:class I SAM-dependent methyltransferase [Effusibacillus lacus]|uniref:Methyltransferase type 11 n=2 Tax=Effusibacillus lacus TaxID=1348429 RepID=A0A292YSB3_9BACL|nr:class I SAM-dependent methyltransferase [Effusibacillus lacus]TCS74995.1 ubiquinone/menaquinone biosynthesis C-methylase UbiE [Effusibacillus lacus]GAX91663.1 methyltransferase type 11 [Effusibacillus lacus]